jgi:hypothetical protein
LHVRLQIAVVARRARRGTRLALTHSRGKLDGDQDSHIRVTGTHGKSSAGGQRRPTQQAVANSLPRH